MLTLLLLFLFYVNGCVSAACVSEYTFSRVISSDLEMDEMMSRQGSSFVQLVECNIKERSSTLAQATLAVQKMCDEYVRFIVSSEEPFWDIRKIGQVIAPVLSQDSEILRDVTEFGIVISYLQEVQKYGRLIDLEQEESYLWCDGIFGSEQSLRDFCQALRCGDAKGRYQQGTVGKCYRQNKALREAMLEYNSVSAGRRFKTTVDMPCEQLAYLEKVLSFLAGEDIVGIPVLDFDQGFNDCLVDLYNQIQEHTCILRQQKRDLPPQSLIKGAMHVLLDPNCPAQDFIDRMIAIYWCFFQGNIGIVVEPGGLLCLTTMSSCVLDRTLSLIGLNDFTNEKGRGALLLAHVLRNGKLLKMANISEDRPV